MLHSSLHLCLRRHGIMGPKNWWTLLGQQRRRRWQYVKVIVGLTLVVAFVTPLRNTLVPRFPHVLYDINTFKLIRMYVGDLFFYVDRTPYTGSCDVVHKTLAKVPMPRLEDMAFYSMEHWNKEMERLGKTLSAEQMQNLDKFKPSMNDQEQRMIMYAMLSATQAFSAFNITYFVRGGTLIGYWRHHGRMPWDEDVDVLFEAEKWETAKMVLSCLPDLQLNMGSDYMWKLFHKDAELWKGEDFIKFPYIDLFLFKSDSEHVWPLTIWMKLITMPTEWTLPPIKAIFEGWSINIPNKPVEILERLYGHVSSRCYAQIFLRRQRFLVPRKEWSYIPCSILRGVYPHVVRRLDSNGKVIEDRMLGTQKLSSFNATYVGYLE